jgi:CheY-like chemotaxis protein/HPt (histidine-containing phosphotransfer) domain-containing protein
LLFLVVDDDELSRELFEVLLAGEGDRVEAAASGMEAMGRLKTLDSPPDAILTDLQMPGLSGAELARELRAAAPSGTLIFAMSGSKPPASALDDFDGFLLKPFTLSDLRSMMTQTGSSRGVPSELAAAQPQPEQAASGTETRVLDEDIYQKLSELMPGEPLAQMYALCLDDARARIGLMRELAAGGDDEGYRREAHAVKGGSGMIGASELYKYATAAETDGLTGGARDRGTSGVIVTLDALSLACDRLERILVERRRV